MNHDVVETVVHSSAPTQPTSGSLDVGTLAPASMQGQQTATTVDPSTSGFLIKSDDPDVETNNAVNRDDLFLVKTSATTTTNNELNAEHDADPESPSEVSDDALFDDDSDCDSPIQDGMAMAAFEPLALHDEHEVEGLLNERKKHAVFCVDDEGHDGEHRSIDKRPLARGQTFTGLGKRKHDPGYTNKWAGSTGGALKRRPTTLGSSRFASMKKKPSTTRTDMSSTSRVEDKLTATMGSSTAGSSSYHTLGDDDDDDGNNFDWEHFGGFENSVHRQERQESSRQPESQDVVDSAAPMEGGLVKRIDTAEPRAMKPHRPQQPPNWRAKSARRVPMLNLEKITVGEKPAVVSSPRHEVTFGSQLMGLRSQTDMCSPSSPLALTASPGSRTTDDVTLLGSAMDNVIIGNERKARAAATCASLAAAQNRPLGVKVRESKASGRVVIANQQQNKSSIEVTTPRALENEEAGLGELLRSTSHVSTTDDTSGLDTTTRSATFVPEALMGSPSSGSHRHPNPQLDGSTSLMRPFDSMSSFASAGVRSPRSTAMMDLEAAVSKKLPMPIVKKHQLRNIDAIVPAAERLLRHVHTLGSMLPTYKTLLSGIEETLRSHVHERVSVAKAQLAKQQDVQRSRMMFEAKKDLVVQRSVLDKNIERNLQRIAEVEKWHQATTKEVQTKIKEDKDRVSATMSIIQEKDDAVLEVNQRISEMYERQAQLTLEMSTSNVEEKIEVLLASNEALSDRKTLLLKDIKAVHESMEPMIEEINARKNKFHSNRNTMRAKLQTVLRKQATEEAKLKVITDDLEKVNSRNDALCDTRQEWQDKYAKREEEALKDYTPRPSLTPAQERLFDFHTGGSGTSHHHKKSVVASGAFTASESLSSGNAAGTLAGASTSNKSVAMSTDGSLAVSPSTASPSASGGRPSTAQLVDMMLKKLHAAMQQARRAAEDNNKIYRAFIPIAEVAKMTPQCGQELVPQQGHGGGRQQKNAGTTPVNPPQVNVTGTFTSPPSGQLNSHPMSPKDGSSGTIAGSPTGGSKHSLPGVLSVSIDRRNLSGNVGSFFGSGSSQSLTTQTHFPAATGAHVPVYASTDVPIPNEFWSMATTERYAISILRHIANQVPAVQEIVGHRNKTDELMLRSTSTVFSSSHDVVASTVNLLRAAKGYEAQSPVCRCLLGVLNGQLPLNFFDIPYQMVSRLVQQFTSSMESNTSTPASAQACSLRSAFVVLTKEFSHGGICAGFGHLQLFQLRYALKLDAASNSSTDGLIRCNQLTDFSEGHLARHPTSGLFFRAIVHHCMQQHDMIAEAVEKLIVQEALSSVLQPGMSVISDVHFRQGLDRLRFDAEQVGMPSGSGTNGSGSTIKYTASHRYYSLSHPKSFADYCSDGLGRINGSEHFPVVAGAQGGSISGASGQRHLSVSSQRPSIFCGPSSSTKEQGADNPTTPRGSTYVPRRHSSLGGRSGSVAAAGGDPNSSRHLSSAALSALLSGSSTPGGLGVAAAFVSAFGGGPTVNLVESAVVRRKDYLDAEALLLAVRTAPARIHFKKEAK